MKRDAKALADLFNALNKEGQQSLFDYAEFLQSKFGVEPQPLGEPVDVPKAENETVVGAIKRLKLLEWSQWRKRVNLQTIH